MPIIPAQLLGDQGIQPASGFPAYGNNWPASGAVPQEFSSAGWTVQARRIQQQTFLGASIVSFNMNGGFGDSSSNLSVELVNDEYNVSDQTPAGMGDDPYHSGNIDPTNFRGDRFAAPMVGSPVFFKFGETFATVEEAYKQTFDDLYNMTTAGITTTPQAGQQVNIDTFNVLGNTEYVDLRDNKIYNYSAYYNDTNYRGRDHLVFGGILQSFIQNRGPGGNPTYSVKAVDPREILSNVTLILNNYSGPTYNNNNLINVYGFLEYNPSGTTKTAITNILPFENPLQRYVATNVTTPTEEQKKNIINNVFISYSGDDTYKQSNPYAPSYLSSLDLSKPIEFPMTGTGFSRRSEQGIPYYRVKQAVNSVMGYNGHIPQEYIDQGFGGKINFRGFNYVVDFGSLPDIPEFYFLDFDQITLLDLILEICDITSKELFVTLLPVINHPAISMIHNNNATAIRNNVFQASGVAGIIRIDAIDRSKQPEYGAIKKYIDSLATSGIYVENQDIGFELSNVTTDKFIVGAQEVQNYFFTNQTDRDHIDAITKQEHKTLPKADRWKLETSLKQQVLPYYGLLGKNAVTIPKGFGSYQQILLDTTGLNANGVGAYYVATEMELRCALISFDRWKEFLLQYNDIYIESLEIDDAVERGYMLRATPPPNFPRIDEISNNYAVTVPRSVFQTYALEDFGKDKLPKSPCNPPYGYPLYYKRATKIGIPEAGLSQITSRLTSILNGYSLLSNADKSTYNHVLNSEFSRLRSELQGDLSEFEKQYLDQIEQALKNPDPDENIEKAIGLIHEFLKNTQPVFQVIAKQARKNTQNALKVYDFIRSIAEECLGKKFLVKVPTSTNLLYDPNIIVNGAQNIYRRGPFGFKPRPNNSIPGYEFTTTFKSEINAKLNEAKRFAAISDDNLNLQIHLNSGTPEYFQGSLKVNYDPVENKHEFNYEPVNNGGFFDFDLCPYLLDSSSFNQIKSTNYSYLPSGLQKGLIPIDLTNFITEDGRVSAYVRFDNSQFLSFDNFNSTDFVQEEIVSNFHIPDISESLDNVKDNTEFSFPKDTELENKPKQVAFVKCQVDERLYMPPKMIMSGVKVQGRKVKQIPTFVLPRKIYDPCTDKYNDSFSYFKPTFVPEATSTKDCTILAFNQYRDDNILKSHIIKTDLQNLDTKNVYALITLPSRAIPLKDSRYRDGYYQSLSAESFKHMMTMDTVDTETCGFDEPVILKKPINPSPSGSACANPTNIIALDHAWFAARQALKKSLTFSFPKIINQAVPSPVYPDLVSLPLMSKERCYGPWVSSQLDAQAAVYSNIGGKVEFIKDENLAPWNYSGYQLMNEAALAQAQFAQSLLLFSERGGFVVPGVPPNVSLGKSLLTLGPLVTDLQVDVSAGGIRTTVKLDLYTANFGKLQKQKQDQISKLSRERQKLKDERNALIRKGIGKSQKSTNYLEQYENIKSAINQNKPLASTIVIGANRFEENRWSSEIGGHSLVAHNYTGSIQDNSTFSQTAQTIGSFSQIDLAAATSDVAAQSVDEMFLPASMTPDHPNMPSFSITNNNARQNLYG